MHVQRLDHISFAVFDVEKVKQMYLDQLGQTPAYEYVSELEKIRVVRYYFGEVGVEFMEPTSEDSEVAKFLRKKGEGLYLISYRVPDINSALAELKGKGVPLIDEKPREIFGARYAFTHHPKNHFGVLLEIIEGDFDFERKKME